MRIRLLDLSITVATPSKTALRFYKPRGPANGSAADPLMDDCVVSAGRSALRSRVPKRYSETPLNIAAINRTTSLEPRLKSASAGPGQRPTRPQPTPNSMEPPRSRKSRSRRVGIAKVAASQGCGRRRATAKPTALTASAAPITNASVGSQCPRTSRKASTLAGFVMPEIARPAPNKIPHNRERRACFTLLPAHGVPRTPSRRRSP